MVGIRRDQVRKAVTRHIGQTHAPVRIAADVDRCRPRECAIPATPEQPDGLGRPVVDQKIRMTVGVDVVQSHGVRVRRDVDAESRLVPAFEGPSGDPEEQRDMVRLASLDRGGRASDDGVEAVEGELCGDVGGWGREGEGGGGEEGKCGEGP